MKKLLNKKFFLILISTITLLVVLSIGMIFLTKENTKSFKKGGYIIASGKADDSIKYYFEEGEVYKTNINNELVFKNTSGEKVNVKVDNFVHYSDGGIKFLKNGVIMDVESINSNIVPYYNITNKSILEYSKKSYYIEALDKTLSFNNIVGKISDDKYIFAGVNVKLQLSGSNEVVTGDYFEVTYIEDGVIRVENQEVSYQTTAENSFVLVNDNIRIDLGTKKIYYDNEERVSLNQMTIDGNENIPIESIDKEDNGNKGDNKGDNKGEDGNNTGNNTGGNTGDNTGGNTGDNTGDNNNPNDNAGDNTGDNTGGNTGGKRSATVDLVKANVGVTDISADFIVNDLDNSLEGVTIRIINTDTGMEEYSVTFDKSVISEKNGEISINPSSLSPESNYILSVVDSSKSDIQYFQKLFRTDELGVSLEKKFLSSDAISYEAVFKDGTKVRSAKITLYDKDGNVVGEPIIVDKDSPNALFENLTSNTAYRVVLDDVTLDNLQYNKVYSIRHEVATLKKTPYLEGLVTEVDDTTNTFTAYVKNVVDEDESIKKYYYYIYKADDITIDNIDTIEPVKIIEKTDNGKVNINIDNDKILPKTNYKFKVIAEYYDNEKYGEYETELSDNFILSGKPTVDYIPDTERTTFNKIVGKVIIKDENCTVPINGRNCSSVKWYNNNFSIEYKVINSTEKRTIEGVKFNPNTLEYELEVDSLIANTEYVFNLYGDVDLLDGKGLRKGYLIGTFRTSTSSIDILTVDTWVQNESTFEDLVNVSARITSSNENMANSINNITFRLYAGDTVNQLKAGVIIDPLATKTVSGNLKDEYYNNLFTINTLDTFGITGKTIEETVIEDEKEVIKTTYLTALEVLKNMTDGKLQKYYTIEINDICDTDCKNNIMIENNYFVFQTPALLLMEDQLVSPVITAEEITNDDLSKMDKVEGMPSKNGALSNTTVVGYKLNVVASVDKISEYFAGGNPVRELIYYACDANKKPNCTIEDAVYTKVIDLTTTSDLNTMVFLERGTAYSTKDDGKLTRGHNYIFKAKFNIDTNNDGETDSYYPTKDVKTDTMKAEKNAPTYRIIPFSSNENSITFNYSISDYDNALYENKFYYTVNDDYKNIKDDSGEEVTDPTDEGDTPTEEEPKELEVHEINFPDNKLSGTITLEGLSTDSVYSLWFKQALIKREANVTKEILGKKVSGGTGEYIFDGKFTYNTNTVTFRNFVNENDNRLRILILENDDNKRYVSRISTYEVTLSSEGVEPYKRYYALENLSECNVNDTTYKCIIVDYADIKEFKTKNIKVEVNAYYDSGIINNDFNNLPSDNYGYLLQINNVYRKNFDRASYININDNGVVTLRKGPSGIYKYNKPNGNMLSIMQMIDTKNNLYRDEDKYNSISYTNGNDGYYVQDSSKKYQVLNNKVVDMVSLGTNNNTFKFNSIIPKINVTTTGLVNGSVIKITPSGLDEDILNNEFRKESDGKYYYYIKIYEDEEKSKLLKEEKLEIELPSSQITLTKYLPNTSYYFEVYAYLLKDKDYKETLLFDAKNAKDYVTNLYKFSSLRPEDIIKTINSNNDNVTSKTEDGIYAKRTLDLYMDTLNNIGEFKVRFDLYNNMGVKVLSKEGMKINSPSAPKLRHRYIIHEDITDKDFVFGYGYYTLQVNVIVDTYNGEKELEVFASTRKTEQDKYLNLTKLVEPKISVTKTEGVNNLKFNVTITDTSKVIKNGKYCVELLNSAGKLVGNNRKCDIDLVDSNGNVNANVTYNYDGLSADTLYIFRVYADIYMNNIDEVEKTRTVENRKVLSTSTTYGVALGSVAAYGSKNSVTLSYSSGVNIKDIKKIEYTLMEKNGGEIASETFIMGDNKMFNVNGETYRLVINPEGLELQSNKSYYVVVGYYVSVNGKLVLLNNKNYEHSIEF